MSVLNVRTVKLEAYTIQIIKNRKKNIIVHHYPNLSNEIIETKLFEN